MEIRDFFTQMGAGMAGDYAEDLKEKDPQKLDQITRMFNNLTELAIQILRTSPEFRNQFAKIHMEFMKHPESRQTIEGAIDAYTRYKSEMGKN